MNEWMNKLYLISRKIFNNFLLIKVKFLWWNSEGISNLLYLIKNLLQIDSYTHILRDFFLFNSSLGKNSCRFSYFTLIL